MNDEMKIM